MPREYEWDINLTQLCERVNGHLGPVIDFQLPYNPELAWDPHYHNLNDFRHQQYLMEREKKRKSTDSSASLASSVPEDLVILTPDESPQIKRRNSGAPKRNTLGELADKMKSFIQEMGKAHEELKAAHEEVRLIAKEAERTNEHVLAKLTDIEKRIENIASESSANKSSIADAKLDISLLRKQCVFKAAPVARGTTSLPAIAKPPGIVAKAPAKTLPVERSSPPSQSSSKKASQEIPEVDWDDLFCAKCNTDYKPTDKHVCKI